MFFTKKMTNLQYKLDESISKETSVTHFMTEMRTLIAPRSAFTSFTPLFNVQIKQIIVLMLNKLCPLDSVPTWLVKAIARELAPAIVADVNELLSSRDFPAYSRLLWSDPRRRNLLRSKTN